MPTYSNGYIPDTLLVTFATGWSTNDGWWKHQLSPATHARHLALVKRAKDRTGRNLQITPGWGAYRPYAAQVLAKRLYGGGAAQPGYSSHGGFWEGKQTLAIDYHNWGSVYGWNQAAWFADCRAVGLAPGMIMRARDYPDEPWHVIDLAPWGSVPAFDGVFTPYPTEETFMGALSDDQQRQMYDALVVNGGQYYMPEAIVGVLRKENQPRLDGIVARTDAANHRLDAVLEMLRVLDPTKTADLDAFATKLRESEARIAQELQQSETRSVAAVTQAIAGANLAALSDADVSRLASAAADEQDRRARERLA